MGLRASKVWGYIRDLPLWGFLRAVLQHWIALMSGIASVILAILATAFQWAGTAPFFWAVATVCGFVAFYRAWLQEFRASHAESLRRQEEAKAHESALASAKEEWDRERTLLLRDRNSTADLEELNGLIERGNILHKKLLASPFDETPAWAAEEMQDWHNAVQQFITAKEPHFLGHYSSEAGFGFEGMYAGNIDLGNYLRDINRRLARLGELHKRWSEAASRR